MNRTLAAQHGIKIGIPLTIVAAAGMALGVPPGSTLCIAMACTAAFVETVLTHFLLAPNRGAYEKAKRMGAYYNNWAALSAASAAVAIAGVYAVWP